MSKVDTFALALLFGAATLVAHFVGQDVFAYLFFVGTIVAFWRMNVKLDRDANFIAEAKQERQDSLTSQEPATTPSKGSRHLFVPPPLN